MQKKIKILLKENMLESLNKLVKQYEKLHGENIETFIKNKLEITETALDIFVKIAKISNLKLSPVTLETEKLKKVAESVLIESYQSVSVPEFDKVSISDKKGTVIFADITKSTEYFKDKKNNTSFVIFNAYILLVKTITRLTNGEFLEHTGDGAMIFYEGKDIIEDFYNSYNYNDICYFTESTNPLCLYFIVSEYLKNYARNKGLLEFDCEEIEDRNNIYCIEPSLVHIGADYGEILEVSLGDMKKLISKTVWNAANRCKVANRTVKYRYEYRERKIYYELPIKTGD